MVKVFLLLMIISMPDMPSVKYNALLYSTMEECIVARDGYMSAYNNKDKAYKDKLISDVAWLEFKTFPVKGLHTEPIGLGI